MIPKDELAANGLCDCETWPRYLAGSGSPDYFNSNSAISMRVVPMLRMPRVVPGSCQ